MSRWLTVLFRPSNFIRGFWFSIALLHAGLFLKRFVIGDWDGGLAQVRLALAVAASVYGLVRMWDVSTVFDRSPRRVFAFGLLLVVMHVGMSPSRYAHFIASGFEAAPVAQVILLSGFSLALAGLGFLEFNRRRKNQAAAIRALLITREADHSRFSRKNYPSLFQRPPPRH